MATSIVGAALLGSDGRIEFHLYEHVLGAAGSYADIYARNLGDRSRLKLARGSNAPAEAGGLFVTPYRE